MADDTPLKLRYFTANLVGLAMIASVFVYAGVVEILQRLYAPFTGVAKLSPSQFQGLKYLFVALALITFFLIRFIQRILPGDTVARLFLAAVFTFALCESVSLYGLLLFLLAGNPLDFYLFMFLSLFYFWLFYPKYQEWEAKMNLAGQNNPKN